jgi:diaminohydroxyphosphoribosylaminopyrimidine deaminase/5-amino-6-(5-phosphoribosylamino)uracil reductase
MGLSVERLAPTRPPALDEPRAWALVRALAQAARAGQALTEPCGVRLSPAGHLEPVPLGRGEVDLYPDAMPCFRKGAPLSPAAERLLDLYLPLCLGETSKGLVIGHIAQSLDGQIATSTGASCFITGPQDLAHTHRLRALCDAVVVGRSTVASDDPRLTTRLVPGRNPTRVVLDPGLRAPGESKVFRDGAAPTLVLCSEHTPGRPASVGLAEVVAVPAAGEVLSPADILATLRARGLGRVFIEGGGVTLSHFLRTGLVDRVHVTVSPVFLGPGRPGLVLAAIDGLDQALRPRARRFMLGDDVLFDCAFRV